MKVVATQVVWVQVSGDYHSEKQTRAAVFDSTASLAEVIAWGKQGDPLGRGDLVIVEGEPT